MKYTICPFCGLGATADGHLPREDEIIWKVGDFCETLARSGRPPYDKPIPVTDAIWSWVMQEGKRGG